MIYANQRLGGLLEDCHAVFGEDAPVCELIPGGEAQKGGGPPSPSEWAGRKIGCQAAAALEAEIPEWPAWLGGGTDPAPECEGGAGGTAGSGNTVLDNLVENAKGEAIRIAKPRIEKRLKPWFIGLPIIGLAAGLTAGYFLWRK